MQNNKKYIYVYTIRANDIRDPIEAIIMPVIIDCGEVYHLHDDGTTTSIWLTPNMLLRITVSLEEMVKRIVDDNVMHGCVFYENDEQKAHIVKKIQAAVKQSKINHYKFLYGGDNV